MVWSLARSPVIWVSPPVSLVAAPCISASVTLTFGMSGILSGCAGSTSEHDWLPLAVHRASMAPARDVLQAIQWDKSRIDRIVAANKLNNEPFARGVRIGGRTVVEAV